MSACETAQLYNGHIKTLAPPDKPTGPLRYCAAEFYVFCLTTEYPYLRDHMSLDVVYCDRGEQTCVAVAVPIKFPYHCDDGELSYPCFG